jgi:hypothetical protein
MKLIVPGRHAKLTLRSAGFGGGAVKVRGILAALAVEQVQPRTKVWKSSRRFRDAVEHNPFEHHTRGFVSLPIAAQELIKAKGCHVADEERHGVTEVDGRHHGAIEDSTWTIGEVLYCRCKASAIGPRVEPRKERNDCQPEQQCRARLALERAGCQDVTRRLTASGHSGARDGIYRELFDANKFRSEEVLWQ